MSNLVNKIKVKIPLRDHNDALLIRSELAGYFRGLGILVWGSEDGLLGEDPLVAYPYVELMFSRPVDPKKQENNSRYIYDCFKKATVVTTDIDAESEMSEEGSISVVLPERKTPEEVVTGRVIPFPS